MIQLKLRSEYSFGQTFAPIPRLIEHLKSIGTTAAGIVDFGSTWGHVRWFDACKAAGIQPLLGVELLVGEEQHAMWFLATSQPSLAALYGAASLALRQPLATRRGGLPRLHYDDVRALPAGVLKFAGTVTDEELLTDVKAWLDLSPSSRVLNFTKQQLAKRTGLKLVNISDNAYASEADRELFELTSDNMKASPQHVLPNLERQEEAQVIAHLCEALSLPSAPMVRMQGDLMALCRQGIIDREMEWNEVYETRLNYEMELIRSKDYESYFLIVADMVRYAKQHMLVGPSRGSAAGSLVCYLTKITEIDPIVNDLMFERFIDMTRGGWKFSKEFAEAINEIPA